MKFKIKEIQIRNLLSYKKANFPDIKNYNVLIGKNNAGKSNLFKIFKALVLNAHEGLFTDSIIFNDEEQDVTEISITFELYDEFREKIFRILYDGNYIKKVKINMETPEGKELKPNIHVDNWNNKEFALKWLVNQEFINFLKIKISFFNKRIIVSKIEIISGKWNVSQPLLKLEIDEKNNYKGFVQTLTNLAGMLDNFKNFFTHTNFKEEGIVVNYSLQEFFKRDYIELEQKLNPVLAIIIKDYLRSFFKSIVIIPDKRRFGKDASTSNVLETEFDFTGYTFVKYIHKLLVTDKKPWLDDFNKQLKHFFTNADEITQIVDNNDMTVLILKEKGVTMKFTLENMGSGILNIALFIASMKLLNRDKILLIEEPELFLYPGLQAKIRDMILEFSRDNQVFITTHSNKFLYDDENQCAVFSIEKVDDKTDVYYVPKDLFPDLIKNLKFSFTEREEELLIIEDNTFWKKFINTAKEDDQVESRFWDFKQTLDMWKADFSLKKKKQIEFCENVVAFANANGGVIIIGITNEIPRKIIGVEDEETKINDCTEKILRWIRPKADFFRIKSVSIEDNSGILKTCLLLIIAQTKKELRVQLEDGTYIYKVRLESGKQPIELEYIENRKKEVMQTNYRFLYFLKKYLVE
ncbi:MAG: AAA family ATPase [Promethearchaeota archaeon]